MKNKIKILLILAVGVITLPMCQKDPDLRIPDLQTGVAPLIEKNTDLDQTIDIFYPEDFEAAVNVDLFFEDMPQSMEIMVAYNDDVTNRAVLRENITSFPTSVNFTMENLIALLPEFDSVEQLNPGDFFRVYAVITLKNGTVIDGLDTLYNAYNPSISNQPGSSVSVRYPVVCPFDPDFAQGDYHCVSEDWSVDGDVIITVDPDDPTTFYIAGMAELDGATEDLGPLVMHINPVTYAVTVDKTALASDFFGYTNFSYEGTGVFNSCDGSYEMSLKPTVAEGGWGTFTYTFTRND
ncbi:MAG: hypothetical protein R6X09_10235 [Bacteroidales bacterium]